MTHDPGGKTCIPLELGVTGKAFFSGQDNQYRTLLERYWEKCDSPFALWIGCNPSTASGDVDDPTCKIEQIYTRDRLGLGRYIKANIADYRLTDPKLLARVSAPLRSEGNLSTILRWAKNASKVVLVFGKPPKPLEEYGRETVTALHEAGIQTWCLGTTAEGYPRHPLYVKRDTPLQLFGGRA